jgi:hypothetical protein
MPGTFSEAQRIRNRHCAATLFRQYRGNPEETTMTKVQLLSTAAASLLLTAGIASAQMQQQMPERAPSAQQAAPAEKVAPPMHAGDRKGSETTGQGVKSSDSDRGGSATETPKASDKADTKSGHSSSAAPTKSEDSSDAKNRADVKNDRRESKDSTDVKSRDVENKSGANEKSKESAAEKSSTETSTSGQGAAGGSAKLSSEQRTKITTIIKKQKIEHVSPAKLNISIRVGERIPSRVHFYPVPVEVVDVYPEWRGYLFLMVGNQILIISPDDHEIVAVLAA